MRRYTVTICLGRISQCDHSSTAIGCINEYLYFIACTNMSVLIEYSYCRKIIFACENKKNSF